jgi:DNA-binding transcriptional LysR family regulator
LLQEVRARLSGVRLQITEGSSAALANMLMRGQLDLAVVFDDTTSNGLLLHPILREPLLLVGAAGSFPSQKPVPIREAAARPLLLLSRPNSIREAVERMWSAADVTPNVVAELSAPRLLVEAVKAGLGYSILPSCGIEDAVQQGQLEAVELKGARLTRTVFLGQSRMFPLSRAAEVVHELMEGLVRTAVSQGRWRGQIIPAAVDGKASATIHAR